MRGNPANWPMYRLGSPLRDNPVSGEYFIKCFQRREQGNDNGKIKIGYKRRRFLKKIGTKQPDIVCNFTEPHICKMYRTNPKNSTM